MIGKQQIACIFGLALAAAAPQALAVNFGVGYAYNSGDSENDDGTEQDLTSRQFGFVLDTGSIKRTFQYRLALDFIDGSIENTDYDGWAITNHFGFRLNNGDRAIIWFGPTIHIANVEFDNNGSGSGGNDGTLYAIGPTLGLNIPLGSTPAGNALALELGYRDGEFDLDDNSTIFFGSSREVRDYQLRVNLLFGD